MALPRTADGEDTADFRFIGGRICLDFVATLGKRHAGPVERLRDPASLAQWFGEAGLRSPAAEVPRVGDEGLAQARVLREAVYRLVRAAMEGRMYDRGDTAAVNRAAARPDLVPQLGVGERGPGVRWGQGRDTGAALATVARDAVLLLGGPLVERVKECGNPACSLLFLDDSQARRRRWCSMDRCGNLAKVAGYRARARHVHTEVPLTD
jgi:predicted RNA-binding Zn ribbon-like protein